MVSVDDVRAALAEVIDPELPVSIVDLGLVRSIAVHGATVSVGITFTSIACPCTDLLREDPSHGFVQFDLPAPPYLCRNTVHYGGASWIEVTASPTAAS